ncbi:MAG: carboxypeptidase regulatory-like domain-containing protein [Flavobacteriales bacterium]|jgi:hypothetical protein
MERMLRILSCLLAIVLCNKTADAQERLLHGRVLDALDDRPVAGAHITLGGEGPVTTSDPDGRFSLVLGECSPCSLVVSHVSYETLTKQVADHREAESGPWVLRLQRKVVELGVVDVRRPAPEVVFQRTDLHVGDYLVNDEGLWVLVYEQKRLWHSEQEAGATVYRGGRLYLLDTLFQERSSVRLPGEVSALHADHALRPVVEGRTMGWYAQQQGDGLALQPVELATLRKAVLPWTDSIHDLLLGNNLNAEYPAFDHIAYDPKRDSALLVCSVVDEFLLELFRSQYKYMSGRDKVIASDIALRTGLEREVVAGFMTGFSHDLYYRVPYAPLFVVHDTLRVFDHYRERIRPFTASLEPLADVPLTHHNERHWKQRLLHDVHDDRIYALFAQGVRCWLREVDVRTGALGPVRMLTHASPEEVQVHAGHAYYVYRVSGSLQTRTLYREALR